MAKETITATETATVRKRWVHFLGASQLPETCPLCGSDTILEFGIFTGTLGAYAICVSASCDFRSSIQDQE